MNQTVPVGSVAEFFCQVRGDHEQIRVDGELLVDARGPPRPLPEDITYYTNSTDDDEGSIIDVNVTIKATTDRNNTVISCVGVDQNRSPPSIAVLIVQGRINSTLVIHGSC